MVVRKSNDLTAAETAKRSGLPVSTLHFYEAEGLIESWRTPSNHRRFNRSELHRFVDHQCCLVDRSVGGGVFDMGGSIKS